MAEWLSAEITRAALLLKGAVAARVITENPKKTEDLKMNRITLLNLIKNGGATLNARGESVNFSRGYQVSKKDCYILEVGAVNKILKAVNKLLSGLQSCDFVGLW